VKWKRTFIPKESLSAFITNLEKSIKAGDPLIEKTRCVYLLKDNPIIQCLMPYDFFEDLENGITIEQLYIYQVSETDT
jgi:hypothetical protein